MMRTGVLAVLVVSAFAGLGRGAENEAASKLQNAGVVLDRDMKSGKVVRASFLLTTRKKADLALLSECKALQDLVVGSYYPIEDADMKVIAQLKSLRRLEVTSSKLTDAGVARLKELPNLKEVWLADSPDLTAASFQQLKAMKKLEGLSFSGTQLKAEDLKGIGDLKKLTRLELTSLPVDDQTLKEIATLPELRQLGVAGCGKITLAGIKELKALPKLAELNVASTPLANSQLSEVQAALPKVKLFPAPTK